MAKKPTQAAPTAAVEAEKTLQQAVDEALQGAPEGESVEFKHGGQKYVVIRAGGSHYVECRGD